MPLSALSRWSVPLYRDAPTWVFPAALLLFFVRFGYDYGSSDQDEVVPFLLHRLDAGLFTHDWFVMTQASEFGVRSYFVTILQSVATFLPVWLTVLLVYGVVWLALAAGVYALARRLTADRLAAVAAVVGVLVLTPQWTLGGNDLASSILVPSMVAWALGLWGFLGFLHARWVGAGVLLGLAAWMQALVGLQLAGLLGLILLERLLRTGTRGLRPLLRFSAAFAASALPALAPLIVQQVATAPAGDAGTPSLFYIMAQFRNPHHYLFFSFPTGSLLRFGGLLVLGGASFLFLKRRRPLRFAGLFLALLGWITLLGTLAFFFTEVVPILTIAKLQLFKPTVLAKVLLLTLICAAVSVALPAAWAGGLSRFAAHPRRGWALTLAATVIVVAGVGLDVGGLGARARPLAHRQTPVAQLEAWVRTETPRTAVFAVPPSWSGFRSRAERALVVDFKAFPFRDRHIVTWFRRLMDVAPITLPPRATPAVQARLDAAFSTLPDEALLELARRYGVDYAVLPSERTVAHDAFERVFTAGPWTIYRIVPTDLARR